MPADSAPRTSSWRLSPIITSSSTASSSRAATWVKIAASGLAMPRAPELLVTAVEFLVRVFLLGVRYAVVTVMCTIERLVH